ncbi:hypothetical protein [Bacteroides acidifaciens]|uniref:hypothetical protein n=1 Tax=Bacteroides acidifaciens TaxID=85831 RepID=UPI003F68C826
MKANNLFLQWVCLLCLLNVAEIIRAQILRVKLWMNNNRQWLLPIVVLLKTDSTFVEGTLSREDGTFQLKNVKVIVY